MPPTYLISRYVMPVSSCSSSSSWLDYLHFPFSITHSPKTKQHNKSSPRIFFSLWGRRRRFFDPIFALSIGFTAAAVRINREEKEKGRSTEQTLEALKRRTSRLVFGNTTTAAAGGAGAGAPVAT